MLSGTLTARPPITLRRLLEDSVYDEHQRSQRRYGWIAVEQHEPNSTTMSPSR